MIRQQSLEDTTRSVIRRPISSLRSLQDKVRPLMRLSKSMAENSTRVGYRFGSSPGSSPLQAIRE